MYRPSFFGEDLQSGGLDADGLRFACLALNGARAPGDAGWIRICVPLGKKAISVTVGGAAQPSVALAERDIAIVRAGRACSLKSEAPTLVGVLWLDNDLFLRHAQAALGVAMELTEEFVAPDAYLRRLASVLKAGLRVGRPAGRDYLATLARDVSAHVASAYAEPRAQARIRGLSAERLSKSLAMIEERLSQPLRVEDLADGAHMSAFHYARMFKVSTGHAPHFFITMRRIERAKEMLSETVMPLAEISGSLGYATQAHFTGVFRMHAGFTPHAYRRRFRPGRRVLPPAS
ncbi:MAG: AraC family transcriptional regulator [Usitatibacter sp.]